MATRSTPSKASKKRIDQETFGLLLLSVRQSLIRRGVRLLNHSGFDINYTQFRVLKALSMTPHLSAKELARTVEHDGGALTRLLDRLQEKGYVARRPNAKDRRGIEVYMTDAGHSVWEEMQACVQQVNGEALGVLSDAEQGQLFSMLHRIGERFDLHADKTVAKRVT